MSERPDGRKTRIANENVKRKIRLTVEYSVSKQINKNFEIIQN